MGNSTSAPDSTRPNDHFTECVDFTTANDAERWAARLRRHGLETAVRKLDEDSDDSWTLAVGQLNVDLHTVLASAITEVVEVDRKVTAVARWAVLLDLFLGERRLLDGDDRGVGGRLVDAIADIERVFGWAEMIDGNVEYQAGHPLHGVRS